jgi:signal transduction histidine kinase
MSKDVVRKAFDPYFTTKATGRNFGLGLSYCKSVIEKHDGRIRINSEPGIGSTVVIELPVNRIKTESSVTEPENG